MKARRSRGVQRGIYRAVLLAFAFEPHELRTLYTWSMEIVPTGPGGNLAAKLFRRFMQNNARKQQARFKIMETASY